MITAAPPPEPPGQVMTVEQHLDLDCLTFAKTLQASPAPLPGKAQADAMARAFSDRLAKSDPRRDWNALTTEADAVLYGWFMGHSTSCPERLKRPSARPRDSLESAWASVRLGGDGVEWLAKVDDGPSGYRLVVDCLRGCLPATRYVENVPDSPISLFRLWDGDDLLLSVWAGGSTYRVRAWKVGASGIVPVLEASSRSRPDFLSAADGAPTVRTHEADSGIGPRSPVLWEYRDGAFHRR